MRVATAICLVLGLGLLAAGCATTTEKRPVPPSGVTDSSFDTNGNRPPSGDTLFALARILAAQGRDDECRQMLERIVSQEPQFMAAYSDLAELHVRHNQVDDAIDVLKLGLSRKADDAVLWNNLGMCWFLQEDYAKAADCFAQAKRSAPTEKTYQANRAAALAMQGQYEEAQAAYQEVFHRDKDSIEHNLTILTRARGQQSTTRPAATQAATADAP